MIRIRVMKVGDKCICTCGSELCKGMVFIVVNNTGDTFIHLVDRSGKHDYLLERNLKKISDMTDLEKILYNVDLEQV